MNHYDATGAFFGALRGLGLTDAVISPGLRSAPLSLAAHATPGLRITVQHDERVGGFVALGIARTTARPVAVVCTSGSALANLMPAVVEAHHSRIPLLVLTGDRPPELHGWDSPQTIHQSGLFGSFATSIDMPVGSETSPDGARRFAAEAWRAARATPSGPVHVNWPFREPLEPAGSIDVPVLESVAGETPQTHEIDEDALGELSGTERGLIAVGGLDASDRAAVLRISEGTGWPIVADPLSGLRTPGRHPSVVTTADHLLAHDAWADEHVPDVVLRLGAAPTSKSLRLWMERTRPKSVVVVDPAGRRRDPSRTATRVIEAGPSYLAGRLDGRSSSADEEWARTWRTAEALSVGVIDAVAETAFEEAAATRATADALTSATTWHVASSTPIRDVDWYVAETAATISSNRGTNGIDGTVSTALGQRIGSEAPVVVTLGDVALIHDLGGVFAAGRVERRPTIIVYDNGGGGIFSLLPIADTADQAAFTDVLHTPTALDVAGIAGAAGFAYTRVATGAALREVLASSDGGSFVHVPLTVAGSRGQLADVRTAIAAAL